MFKVLGLKAWLIFVNVISLRCTIIVVHYYNHKKA